MAFARGAGGHTARKSGREKLAVWLKHLENRSRQQPEVTDPMATYATLAPRPARRSLNMLGVFAEFETDRLLGRSQGDTLGLELVHDVLKVFQRTRQSVDTCDDERVAGTQKVEQHLQLGAAVATRTTGLLGTNHLAARRLQRGTLDREIVIDSRYPGVTVNGHGMCEASRYRLDPLALASCI
jgi:hypothetical protein